MADIQAHVIPSICERIIGHIITLCHAFLRVVGSIGPIGAQVCTLIVCIVSVRNLLASALKHAFAIEAIGQEYQVTAIGTVRLTGSILGIGKEGGLACRQALVGSIICKQHGVDWTLLYANTDKRICVCIVEAGSMAGPAVVAAKVAIGTQ